MSTYFDQVEEAAAFLRTKIAPVPDVAIVLGSGLGAFAGSLGTPVVLPYPLIPHWPASRVVGHAGQLVAGTTRGRRVLALSGRAHFYEGHDLATVTFATRVLGRLGVKTLFLTNAAGGINTKFGQGALMVIDDHINLMGSNPLIGVNDDRFGKRLSERGLVESRDLPANLGDRGVAGPQMIEHIVKPHLRVSAK
jgi:purine-nucleoside phosphorylase